MYETKKKLIFYFLLIIVVINYNKYYIIKMPYAITKEQMNYAWKGCLANMEKDDSVIFLHQATFHKHKMLSVMNNKEVKIQAKMWQRGLLNRHRFIRIYR